MYLKVYITKYEKKIRNVNRRIVGNSEDVPDVMFVAEKFVKAFRASELGKLILDIELMSRNLWNRKIFATLKGEQVGIINIDMIS